MTITGIILSIAILLVLPFFLGLLFYEREESKLFIIAKGILIQWCIFYVLAVPCIILQRKLSELALAFFAASFMAAFAGIIIFAFRRRKYTLTEKKPYFFMKPEGLTGAEMLYLSLFLGILLFQLYKTVFFSFTDGDDAFYVASAQTMSASDTLYRINPYTGAYSGIVYRYALAPFPAWIAVIARVTGLNASTVAHVVVNAVLVTITYVIYNEIAKKLYESNREKRYMFMTLLSVFAVFSNVSQSMAETFLLTRARQGKEALANIIIPFMFYIFLSLAKRKDTFDVKFKDMVLFAILAFAGGMTSVFSSVLLGIGLASFFVYAFIKKSNIKTKLYIMLAAVPELFLLALYLKLG